MPELIVSCSRCGREWSPDRLDYIRGLWRICPGCRDGPEDPPTETPDDVPINNEKDNAS